MPPRLLGAVIAGGQSRRFGSDKARAMLNGKSLLQHSIEGIAAQTDALVICGRDVLNHTCLPDRPAPGLGPLGGLAAALRFASTSGFDAVLTTACDTPEVPPDLAAHLCGPEPAVIAGQPLFGWWPTRYSAALDAHLAGAGSLSVLEWITQSGARRVDLGVCIPNVNTPADLAALRQGHLISPPSIVRICAGLKATDHVQLSAPHHLLALSRPIPRPGRPARP